MQRIGKQKGLLGLIALLISLLFGGDVLGQQTALVIRNISVVDGVSPVVQPNRTVVIVGNRITAIGESGKVAIPRKAKVINGTGKYLIPGLWDSHVHLRSADPLPLFIANGVTGVREMGGDLALVKDLRDRVASGQLLGPRIKISGSILESEQWMKWATGHAKKDNDTGMLETLAQRITISDPEQAREAIRKLAGQGVDLIKVRNTHSADAFLAILSEAKKYNIPVAAHAPRMNLVAASDGGLRSIEHVETVASLRGNVEVDELAKAFVRNGTFYTPTLIIQVFSRLTPRADLSELLTDAEGKIHERNRYVSPSVLERWKKDFEMQKNEGTFDWAAQTRKGISESRTMKQAGVVFLAGTDFGAPLTYAGFSLHDELEALTKESGLTPFEALQSATSNSAKFFGMESEIGTVTRGKLADLVILTANPLENISNTRKIDGVILNGRYLPSAELSKMKDQAR